MGRDRFGLEMAGSDAAVAAYDEGLGHLLRFQPEVVTAAEAALAADPGCVMARALRAYVSLMSSEAPDAAAARELLKGAAATHPRERAHLEALAAWTAGDWYGAARRLDALLVLWPRDVLALAVGHQLDFFVGDSRNLRDRVARARAHHDPRDSASGFFDGMWAFGLEECGEYVRAEAAGRSAIERNPDDVWALHAVAHVEEMQGRVREGVADLESRRAGWWQGNFLNVHLAWHLALFRLEAEDHAGVLELYDALIHNADSAQVAMEMLDAAAMLWRLHLDGTDTGDRFAVLAQAWAKKDAEPWYVFNDLHAIQALVGAGRLADAERRLDRLARFAREGDDASSNHRMVVAAGLPAARALCAFGRGDHGAVIRHLAPVRHHLAVFGGSHAQRDVFQRTLVEAAVRAGEGALADQLLAERLAARPGSTFAWARMARRRRAAGDVAGAVEAEARRAGERAALCA
jgi:tetratricopeptide (TPR) repeat protein